MCKPYCMAADLKFRIFLGDAEAITLGSMHDALSFLNSIL